MHIRTATLEEAMAALSSPDLLTIGFDSEWSGPTLPWDQKSPNPYLSTITGFSVAWEEGNGLAGLYVPLRHLAGKNVPYFQGLQILSAALGNPKREVWGWNWKSDLRMLRLMGVEPPCILLDGMIAAFTLGETSHGMSLKGQAKALLGEEVTFYEDLGQQIALMKPESVEAYTIQDASLALVLGLRHSRLLSTHSQRSCFTDLEMPAMRSILRMEDLGVMVDCGKLFAMERELAALANRLREEWDLFSGGLNIRSSKQLQALYESGVWSPEGIDRTATGSITTNADAMQTQLARLPAGSLGHTLASIRLEFQAIDKNLSTYTTSLAEKALVYPDGRLHPNFNQCVAATGRLSSDSPNFQNIPTRTELGRRVRQAFVAPPGMVLVSADYSQIELRMMAHFAGGKLAEAYQQGLDLHQATADLIGCSRDQAKTLNFCILYGGGAKKVSRQTGLSVEASRALIRRFDGAYPEVKSFKDRVIRAAAERGYVATLSGKRRQVNVELLRIDESKLSWETDSELLLSIWREQRIAVNTPIQGGAADIMKLATNNLMSYNMRLVGQVHDQNIVEAPIQDADKVAETLKVVMCEAADLRVPLEVDLKVGQDWSMLK